MKNLILIAVALLLTNHVTRGEEPVWHKDFKEAASLAEKEDRLILLYFNGSDWCPHCKRMRANIFSKSEFAAFAKTNLVLVDVDFPKKKLPSKQRRQNDRLAARFKARITPTIVLLSSKEKLLLKEQEYSGYDVAEFIAKVENINKEEAEK